MSATLDHLLTHPPHGVRPDGDGRDSTASAEKDPNPNPTDDRRLLLVLMLINENMQRQLVIRELAVAVNLSPGRLAHVFRNELGVSPQRYLNNIRMERAKELLVNGVLSIKEIASEVGIRDVSRFCRSFRTSYGTTPKEYRKTHLRLDLESTGAAAAA